MEYLARLKHGIFFCQDWETSKWAGHIVMLGIAVIPGNMDWYSMPEKWRVLFSTFCFVCLFVFVSVKQHPFCLHCTVKLNHVFYEMYCGRWWLCCRNGGRWWNTICCQWCWHWGMHSVLDPCIPTMSCQPLLCWGEGEANHAKAWTNNWDNGAATPDHCSEATNWHCISGGFSDLFGQGE